MFLSHGCFFLSFSSSHSQNLFLKCFCLTKPDIPNIKATGDSNMMVNIKVIGPN